MRMEGNGGGGGGVVMVGDKVSVDWHIVVILK